MSEMTLEQYEQAQKAEYSAYVAKEAIDIDGARAFNVGDPVPKGHVDRGVVRTDQVVKTGTKAATTAQAASPTNPVEASTEQK